MTLPPHIARSEAARVLRGRRFRLVDVGARGGLPPHWSDVGPLLDAVAFDADEQEARRLSAAIGATGASVQVLADAVWETEGVQPFHLTRSPGCSSLFRPHAGLLDGFPDAGRYDTTRTTNVTTAPLDALLRDRAARPVRFVKIDAQGGALAILRGAVATIDTAVGLEVEVEFVQLYEGQPLFSDVDEFLRGRRFDLVDLRPTYWRRNAARHVAGTRGQLVFADALYMRAPEQFAADMTAASSEDGRHLAASAALACYVYGLPDWAASYAAALGSTHGSAAILSELSHARASRFWSYVPFRYPLGQWLKDVGDRLVESPGTWAVAEQRLGGKPRLGRRVFRRAWRRLRR